MKVLVRETIADAGVELLRAKFDVDVDSDSPLDEIIGDYDAIVVRSATKLTADLIELGDAPEGDRPRRAWASTTSTSTPRRGAGSSSRTRPSRTSSRPPSTRSGLLVALARNIPQAHAALVAGRWERSKWGGVELADKTLGVLGFGRIGRQVARRALGLQMKVVAYDPFVSAERFRELGVESATFDEVLARADFLTLHLPLNDETRGAIDADAIAKMRDGVRIVNAARGELARRGRAHRRARVGQGRRRRDRRLRRRSRTAARCSRRRTSSSRRISPPRPTRRRTGPA